MSVGLSSLNTNLIWFNPTTGFTVEQTATLKMQASDDLSMEVVDRFAYAISAKRFFNEVSLNSYYKRQSLRLTYGKFYVDWKDPIGDPLLTNTFTSLFMKLNFKKMALRQYAVAHYEAKPLWGMHVQAEFRYDKIKPVDNVNDFSFFKRDHRFSRNVPYNQRLVDGVTLSATQQGTASFAITYTPRLRYYTNKQGQRIETGSRWPTFGAYVQRGLGSLTSEGVGFTHASFSASKQNGLSLNDRIDWMLEGGFFEGADNASFANWKHFRGSNKIVALADIASGYKGFVTFRSYELSTNQWYVCASVHYQTQSLLVKKFKPLSRFLFSEELYLKTANIGGKTTYTEVGYGFARIAFMLRMSVFASFIDHEIDGVYFRSAISLADLIRRRN